MVSSPSLTSLRCSTDGHNSIGVPSIERDGQGVTIFSPGCVANSCGLEAVDKAEAAPAVAGLKGNTKNLSSFSSPEEDLSKSQWNTLTVFCTYRTHRNFATTAKID